MLRLKSPGFERLLQNPTLEATFGGSESNVAVALANLGNKVSFVTKFPDNAAGHAGLARVYMHNGDLPAEDMEKAEEHIKKALELDPSKSRILQRRVVARSLEPCRPRLRL